MINASDRKTAIMLIQEATQSGAHQKKACQELGINERTLQRWQNISTPLADQRPIVERPVPKNKLTEPEVNQILDIVNQLKFQSLPPSQIVPRLADENIYIASESTFYRVLKDHEMQHHRGRSKRPNKKPISTHSATGPNQVWMWDITWLPGPARGIYFYLYLILDLYSRKIIAWDIWTEESAEHASILVRRGALSEQMTAPHSTPLVLHSDNGSPMKGASLLETLYNLGVTPSKSRPRVSNDNPYAESVFRTCKYRPSYPAPGFTDLTQARKWVLDFVRWYNTEHRHSGLNFLTPNQRHTGKDKIILENRHKLYEQARAAHPERWSKGTRNWTLPDEVWLNPEKVTVLTEQNQTSKEVI